MISKREKCLFVVLTCAAMIFMPAISSVFIKEVKAQEVVRPKLQFEPSDITAGQLGQDLPSPVVTVNITVSNVTDMYAWQTKIYFDQSVISLESPAVVRPAPAIDMFRGFTSDQYMFLAFTGTDHDTSNRYLQVGGTLLADLQGVLPSVNGTGVLAQVKFRGQSSASSYMNFSRPYGTDTYLWNTTAKTSTMSEENIPIPADVIDAKVDVLGYGISIVVHPETIEIGGSANITGAVYPRPESSATSVVISYMPNGTTDWKELATVQPVRVADINVTYYSYSYTWTPEQLGLYFIRAVGGNFTSQQKTLLVSPSSEPPPPNLWLLYGPPAAFAGAVVSLAFVWDRRRRHSNRMILP